MCAVPRGADDNGLLIVTRYFYPLLVDSIQFVLKVVVSCNIIYIRGNFALGTVKRKTEVRCRTDQLDVAAVSQQGSAESMQRSGR